jgi:hypothetical protein
MSERSYTHLALQCPVDRNMGERILSILFGCLATMLAIVGIILAYIQYRTYTRQSINRTTPSALEIGHSTSSTTSDELEVELGRWRVLIMLPFVIYIDLVRRLYVSRSNIRTEHLANEYSWGAIIDSKPWALLRQGR